MLFLSQAVQVPAHEFEFRFVRSSGPGGQNVNKVNSKAMLRWNPCASPSLPEPMRQRFLARFASKITREGEIIVTSDIYRDQASNQRDCLEKLRQMLLLVLHPPKPRKATKPTRSSKRKRLDSKQRHGAKKSTRRKPDYE